MFGDGGLTDRVVAVLFVSAACVLLAGAVAGVVLSGTTIAGLEKGDTDGADTTQTDPSTLDAERDLSQFERSLARRLQQRVESGAVNLSQGQYESVRDRINSTEYESLLASYQSVASETGNESRARALARLQRSLANYSALVERYRSLHGEYQFARESTGPTGDDAGEVRAIARRLERIYRNATAAANRTLDRFEALDPGTRLNVSTSAAAIRADLRNLSDTQASVRAESFVGTRLDVAADSTTVGFDDPVALSGTLRMANGTAIANRSVTLGVGEQVRNVTTNAAGGFALTYRPVRLPTNVTALTVEYEPADASPYLGSERRIPVDVSQIEPTVTVSRSASSVGYNDTLRVEGRVSVGDTGAGGVPVVVSLDERRPDETATDASGSYAVETSIPPDVSPGERVIDVRVPLEGVALAGTNVSTTVDVRERATGLSVSGESVEGRLVRLTGRLQVESGPGVANRTVAVGTGDTTLTTVRTGPDGRINATVVVPQSAAGGDVSLSVRFDGDGLNLGSASATTTVAVADGGLPVQLVVAVPVLAVVGAAAVAVVVRRRRRATGEDVDPGTETPERPEETTVGDPEALLSLARSRLGTGDPDEAVRAAYAAVRVAMGGTGGATHWEFYRSRAEDGLAAETVETLRDLTTTYERASYADESVSEREGERMVDAAASLAAPSE